MCCDLKQDVISFNPGPLFRHHFFSPENVVCFYVCCIYSSALQASIFVKTNNLNPDQTAREQSDLGPHCLQFRLPKNISRRGEQTTSQDWWATVLPAKSDSDVMLCLQSY